jgi:predicted nucleotide-binding protein
LMQRAKWFTTPPTKTFIMHGEESAQKAIKSKLEEIWFTCTIPSLKDTIEL